MITMENRPENCAKWKNPSRQRVSGKRSKKPTWNAIRPAIPNGSRAKAVEFGVVIKGAQFDVSFFVENQNLYMYICIVAV